MNRLANKIILITGATSEIALAFVQTALQEGAEAIVMTGIDDAKGVERAAQFGKRCKYRRLDVRCEQDWQHVMAWIKQEYGRLHVLVNNAGITGTKTDPPATDLSQTTLQAWHTVYQTNLDGVFLGCREAIPLMRKSGKAAIVNIGSRSGLVGRPDRVAYASSKAALVNLSRSIAIDCAEQGFDIRCNIVLPSCIMTSIWEPVLGKNGNFNQDLYDQISHAIPVKRFGTPDEVANTILFLASDESSYITGTEIIIDGGAQARDVLRAGAFFTSGTRIE